MKLLSYQLQSHIYLISKPVPLFSELGMRLSHKLDVNIGRS